MYHRELGQTMNRGPRPNPKRRRQMAKLRALGLSYRQIGQRLGCLAAMRPHAPKERGGDLA